MTHTSFLSALDWRMAAKSFDTSKKVSPTDLDAIKRAILMTPTSFGMQPFRVVLVSDPTTLQKLSEAAFGQKQVAEASHCLVFCARTDLETARDEYFTHLSGGDAEKRAALAGFETMVTGFLSDNAPEWVKNNPKNDWAKKQTYITLGFAMAACAELGIDSCPMEGFDSAAVENILGLENESLSVSLMLPIGYRAENTETPAKFRRPETELFLTK